MTTEPTRDSLEEARPPHGFRDQLRIIMAEGLADAKNTTILYDHGHLVADLVLNSPEMQAIRQLLKAEANANVRGYVTLTEARRQMVGWLERRQMPASVIEWALA